MAHKEVNKIIVPYNDRTALAYDTIASLLLRMVENESTWKVKIKTA